MSDPAGYPAEGDTIGPYRVTRRIGGGGMGVVLEAEDPALDRHVAVKVLAPQLAGDAAFRARFTREAQALASLDSPHVVHVYAHGEDQGRLYLVTQLLPDGDLGEMLRTFGAPPTRVGLDLMAQVAGGLADAHAAGLVHRDIKPANVLLRRRENAMTAYLSDFGIARQVDADHTRTGGLFGTPSYMAPELYDGASANVASDIYSMGCLLWATLSGKAPYTGTSEYQIVRAHHESEVPQLPDGTPLAAEINRILRTAMAKDPAERFAEARQLRDVLRRARSMPPTSRHPLVPPVVGRGRGGPRMATRARVVAGSTVLALGLVAVVTAAVVLGDDEPGGSFSQPGPSLSVTPSPSSGAEVPAPDDDDLATATASLTQALSEQDVMTREQARCTAEEWIAGAGLVQMARAGFFDAEWSYVDLDRSAMTPPIERAAAAAAVECAG